eukprot:COSAG02_NODE_2003_length_10135_cov_9.873754_5_plen_99_part_00
MCTSVPHTIHWGGDGRPVLEAPLLLTAEGVLHTTDWGGPWPVQRAGEGASSSSSSSSSSRNTPTPLPPQRPSYANGCAARWANRRRNNGIALSTFSLF